ncbi:hypothetical protein A8C75_20775 [Marinobacterium aestuarii]|uniref:DUF3461 domain-containing protein n=1 Tax=Marinobacterium aestuarii TaxID=1821621 RepID=A0A1A9F498_9GAMM|nr:DUF3461 family protein [Marinobacterium aestuarii]ANG64671.1 hypothetical protein A8C75_20775 [Marinobacterium aestuarii]
MSDYPTLEEMGISSFEDITKYSLRRESDVDVLKIYYKRPKASLLSRSKKFTFARPRKSIPMQFRSGEKWDSLTDSSPTLQSAVIELNKLTTQPAALPPEDVKARFLEDLNHLETVVNSKIDELRRQIESMK